MTIINTAAAAPLRPSAVGSTRCIKGEWKSKTTKASYYVMKDWLKYFSWIYYVDSLICWIDRSMNSWLIEWLFGLIGRLMTWYIPYLNVLRKLPNPRRIHDLNCKWFELLDNESRDKRDTNKAFTQTKCYVLTLWLLRDRKWKKKHQDPW